MVKGTAYMDPPNATCGAVYPPPLPLAPVHVIKHFAKTRGLKECGPARLWQEMSGELLVFRLRIGGHGKMLIYIGGARRDRVIASIRSRDDIAVLATPDPFIGERGGGVHLNANTIAYVPSHMMPQKLSMHSFGSELNYLSPKFRAFAMFT